MAMCRLNNAEFHKFLNEFSEEVSRGRYRKMPYDKYRTFRNWHDTSVDVVLEHYTNLNGNRVQRIRISPDGPTGYEFYIDDGSFGNFCYDYLTKKEEPKMHPDNKPVYDLWGLASESLTSVNKAEDNCCIAADGIGTAKVTTCAGDPYSNYADSCSTAVSTSYTTITDINSERIKELETAVTRLQEEVAQKANIDDVYHLENDLHQRVDELAWCADDHEAAINKLYDELEAMPKVSFQSTSSNCYPVKNYKIDIAGGCVCDDDRKEKENMDTNKMFNGFEFGPVDDRIKMSPYGMAIRNADGRYVSYDAKNGNIMDVEVFNFDNHKLIWKMPVAVSAIAVGDTVIHMKKPMFVTSITNGITVIDIFNGEVKTIVPAQNMFGFNFVTKVVSLFNFTGDNTPTAENPFGNVMPFMLMGNEDMDMKDFFMMMAVANGGNMNAMFQNPFMLYAMMSDNENMKEMLPFMLMGQTGMFGQTPANHQCNCGQDHQ